MWQGEKKSLGRKREEDIMWSENMLSVKGYLRMRMRLAAGSLAALAVMNIYFGVLCASRVFYGDLIYMDALFLAAGGVALYGDYNRSSRFYRLMKEGQKEEGLYGLKDSFYYDFWIQEREEEELEYNELYGQQQELTEYIARWAHEVKLPLSSLHLMNKRNPDEELRGEMQEPLERIQQLLNTMLMGCKLARPENDVQIEYVHLKDAVKESVRNQSYFLIRENFSIDMEKMEDTAVYSDRRWLCYILDQLIANSVKYRKENPSLSFGCRREKSGETILWVEDRGIGIAPEDLHYIFDKGYIGGNLRNGTYHSTGMGLYFVKKTAGCLGADIRVESQQGEGTRFTLAFADNAEHYFL